MDYITLNQAFTAICEIPESISTNTVTYIIYKASDGSVFASGTAIFVAGINWKVSFTPTIENETYIVEVNNQTLDVKYSKSYKCVRNATMTASITSTTAATDAEMLVKINEAITAFLDGGAVQSYGIGNRNLQRCTLKELRELKDYYEQKINIAAGKGRNYAKFVNADD
ncbi:MAG: hypothetical protein PHG31_05040 [Candidatus Omnitrophica bacterium]|nr:hypothetical protein [Candidatus Omnitrophota bacterium]